ncbi:uncharacterized protein [Drosophila virilis]|uniref:Uncharacterized protein n=1 Tax=Drosophila virilis TaxID=7244 RepID=B4M9N9_DROVI|nr:uncharacterized protein LOC6633977 [Drosophila virilis]EDW57915.1 uncharacterized protein Dvir_GJ18353 [Drosophila virilis]
MFSWNSRRYWDLWPYELPLHHFPGQPELPHEPPLEQQQRPLVHFLQPNEVPPAENDDIYQVFNFMNRCYLLAGIFMIITVFQWLLFTLLVKQKGLFVLPGFICLMLAFTALMMLTFCLKLRSNRWFGYIFAWLFVETVAMSVILLLPVRSIQNISVALVAALIVLAVCYFQGAWLPMFILPGVIVLVVVLIVFAALAGAVLILFILTDQSVYRVVYFGLILFVTLPMSLFHAQVIHGRRYRLPKEAFMSCAVIIYMHFSLFFMAFYYLIWVHKW